MTAIAQALDKIVGNSGFWNWQQLTPDWQARITHATVGKDRPTAMVAPSTETELSQVMSCALTNQWRVLPCGNGSKLGWGGVGNDIDLVISTNRLNRVIDHAVGDLTVTVESGIRLVDLQAVLLKTGQFLPLESAYPHQATLGGMIATADSGSWSQRYGGVRDLLLGVSFVRYDGQIAKAGGRVVKNVAGYDLMKLFTGSYGTLGIITQATFRVYPLPETSATVVLTGKEEAIATTAKIILSSALTPTAVDLLSPALVDQLELGQGMGLMVRFQSVAASVQEQSGRLLEVGQQLGLFGTLVDESQEGNLWKQLPIQIWESSQQPRIICKIGVLPKLAVSTLEKLEASVPKRGLGLIHAGSGLGRLWFAGETVTAQTILEMRRFCEAQGGFLTVLEAPREFKQQLEVWGYRGNALEMMRRIKEKFDPAGILSPGRFVGGI